ncbi:hypothetical protein MJO28_016643 [Puccinia striiformis f. sp. tritici]|uniref:Uncharacterized protein n=1 Tax=Puccinia striiformis f. sp. tritici TaxID=168172 RepID=A0ACC0DNR2_9BASI|nr:hypothetical protein Pst134EB_030817 [Puccinia striiformis f. sp. tritici]KAI7935772.1 hypothetical protein MJO28_016643 [Puccinia striiformis f. sp. tritici]
MPSGIHNSAPSELAGNLLQTRRTFRHLLRFATGDSDVKADRWHQFDTTSLSSFNYTHMTGYQT